MIAPPLLIGIVFSLWVIAIASYFADYALLLRHPRRWRRGAIARRVERIWPPHGGIRLYLGVELAVALSGLIFEIAGFFVGTIVMQVILNGLLWGLVVTDWFSDDDDRWKRRRRRATNALKRRFSVLRPAPQLA